MLKQKPKKKNNSESSEENELRLLEESSRAEVDGRKRKSENSDEDPKKPYERKKLKYELLVGWGLPEAESTQEKGDDKE